MDNVSNTLVNKTPPEKSKKPPKQPETWKRNLKKKARHGSKRLPTLPSCRHKDSSTFKCSELTMQDVKQIHSIYYQDCSLESKKQYILQHCSVSSTTGRKCKRNLQEDEEKHKRQVTTVFTLPKNDSVRLKNVRVCKAAFLHILQESKDRVTLLCKRYLEEGVTPIERRGGARRVELTEFRKQAVINYLKKLKPIQNHYCRSKIRTRQYLDSDLSCRKLWKMYLCELGVRNVESHLSTEARKPEDNVPLQINEERNPFDVKYEFFRKIFNENFNIGFAAPYTDRCSFCMRLEYEITIEKDSDKKNDLETELSAHKKRANIFFEKLRSATINELVLSYDCQKNLVLPKIPDQEAYYRRQLYLYNFTICKGVSTDSQTKENTFSYVWTEDKYSKGSVQIASALYHTLRKLNLENIKVIKLFADGCGGQNKNSTMIFMLQYFLLNNAPKSIEKIFLYFPIVGHSFIPPDRVFGNLEREFRAKSVIPNPETYLEIFRKYTTVITLGSDCEVLDWKSESDKIMKTPSSWHFQFQKAKKIVLQLSTSRKNVMIQGEPFYNFETGEPKFITKKNKSVRNANIQKIKAGTSIKTSKLQDVERLLNLHFGSKWVENPELSYYKDVFLSQSGYIQGSQENEKKNDIVMEMEVVGSEVHIIGGCENENVESEDEMDFELMECDGEEVV